MPSATTRTNHTLRSETKDDTRTRDKGAAPRVPDAEGEMGRRSVDAADCVKHWESMVEDGTRRYKEFKNKGDQSGGTANGEHQEEYAVQEIKDVSSDSESGEDEHQGELKEEYAEHRHRRKREHGGEQRVFSKKQKDNKGDGKQIGAGQPGSKDRLLEKGSIVYWKALPGFVEGEVVDIVYEEKTVDGKAVKGKPDDPRIVLKSSSSGKTAVHKPEAVYFE